MPSNWNTPGIPEGDWTKIVIRKPLSRSSTSMALFPKMELPGDKTEFTHEGSPHFRKEGQGGVGGAPNIQVKSLGNSIPIGSAALNFH